jgi:beta-N-acetylhexosaminidase
MIAFTCARRNAGLQIPWTERQEVLERFMVGFDGASLPDDLARLLGLGLAGVAVYSRNYQDAAGLRALTASIRRAAGRPVLIGIDQEGGTRFALKPPFTAWPSPAELGRLGDASVVEQVARAIARELLAVGCNLDFAPMLDLATNPASPVTLDRSFGADAREVAALGCAFMRGLTGEGVLACAKHFPGHGDTDVDPHFDLPRFAGTPDRLAQQELLPFAAAIEAGVPIVMTAHILLTAVDPNRPASISQRVLGGLLRTQLRFEGVILADDLGMGALAKRYGTDESAVKAVEAGADIVMLSHDWSKVPTAIETLADAAEGGRFEPAQWTAARARLARLREKIAALPQSQPPLEIVGCAEHLALAEEVRARLAATATP